MKIKITERQLKTIFYWFSTSDSLRCDLDELLQNKLRLKYKPNITDYSIVDNQIKIEYLNEYSCIKEIYLSVSDFLDMIDM